jgi:hypothetical protein
MPLAYALATAEKNTRCSWTVTRWWELPYLGPAVGQLSVLPGAGELLAHHQIDPVSVPFFL